MNTPVKYIANAMNLYVRGVCVRVCVVRRRDLEREWGGEEFQHIFRRFVNFERPWDLNILVKLKLPYTDLARDSLNSFSTNSF